MRSNRSLELSPEAQDDLRSLLADSVKRWGEAQRNAYAERLTVAMRELIAHPYLGRTRDELAPGMRGFLVGQHVIYYLVEDRTVAVLRLLHERMDPARHCHPPRYPISRSRPLHQEDMP